jgi:cbb3-type cytochrome oxidase cytochrome c subunit/cytochrome c2
MAPAFKIPIAGISDLWSRICPWWPREYCMGGLHQIALANLRLDGGPIQDVSFDVSAEDLHRGLVASYRDDSKAGAVEVSRLEPSIALTLHPGEAAHPRLAADGGIVRWEGYLNVLRPASYRFRAVVRGRFRLRLDGKEVLAAEGTGATSATRDGPETRLEAGVHALSADFTRLPGLARLEVLWQSSHIRLEPLPFDVLGHLPDQETAKVKDDALAERGRFLAEERNCTACHAPQDGDRMAAGLQKRQGPDLSQGGQRLHRGWVYRWLEAPQKLRPGAVMPQLFADDDNGRVERYAVARYLDLLGGPVPKARRYDRNELAHRRRQGQALFTSLGCIACHRTESGKEKDAELVSFYGLGASEGARATYPLTGLGSKTTPEKLAAYLVNPLAIDPSGRMPHMVLQGDEAENLALYLCADGAEQADDWPAPPSGEQVLTAFRRVEPRQEVLAAFRRLPVSDWLRYLGQRIVIDRGCNACHTITPGGKPFAAVLADATFADLKKHASEDKGCLARERGARGKAPWFGFAERDRKALHRFLAEGTRGAGSAAPAYEARVTFKRFNCLACHSRDGEGGLTPDVVEELRRFEKAENAEAVSPPVLTGAGHKLRTPWLRQVLIGAGRARPWMALRMPQFGKAQVGRLPEALAALDGTEPDESVHKIALTPQKVEAGRFLVGKNAFGCVSCHDIGGIPNSGTRGPDLALMDQRVRYEWYRRWLEQPQRLQPGTRMPTVFNEGKSTLATVLGGSADAQADAMWAYLSLGPGLPLPQGLEPPKGLIVKVEDRPVLLRTFMPDAGSRAVAVGYPGGVATVFDAARCRLAYAWSGNFLDASPVWADRGGNPAHVLGPRFWNAPPGCPWGATASQEPPDFGARAKDPAYGADLPEGQLFKGVAQVRFEGYSVDHAGRPTFRYQVGAGEPHPLAVSEQPEPLHAPVAAGLARHFVIEPPEGQTPWLLAGESGREPQALETGGSLSPLDLKSGSADLPAAGRPLVLAQDGDRVLVLTLKMGPEGCRWHVRRSEGRWQVLLRLPIAAGGGQEAVQLDLWAPYRAEPAFLKDLAAGK